MNLVEWTKTCHIGDKCKLGDIYIECVEQKHVSCSSCFFSPIDCTSICCSCEERQDGDFVRYEAKFKPKETNVEVIE